MNTSRATVGIAIAFLAAALLVAGAAHQKSQKAAPSARDPSVPSASDTFRQAGTKTVSSGNVEDMAY
jgi:hypothetical protein